MIVRIEKKEKSINFVDVNVDIIAQKVKVFNDLNM
jgi:hypothetical protein